MTRDEVVEYTRTMIDTPWTHQGRLIGSGLDCVGIPILICRQFGVSEPDFNITGYGRQPDEEQFRGYLRKYLNQKPYAELKVADIVTFHLGRECHVGLISGFSPMWFIHSSSNIKRCDEGPLSKAWQLRIRSVFEFPGITD